MRIGGLARNTLLSSSGLVMRAGLQAVYLILLSRWLGAGGYGLFAGTVAAAMLLAPLSGWGMGYVFTERLAGGVVNPAAVWRAVTHHAIVSGLLFALIAVTATQMLLPMRVSLIDMALLALAEVFAMPLAQVSTLALLALDRGGQAALAPSLIPAMRVVGVSLLIAGGASGSIHLLALTHCVGSLLGAALLIAMAEHATRQGRAEADDKLRQDELGLVRAGAPYAASSLTSGAYFEVDKVLILQLLGTAIAGVYTAAFRVVAVFILPVMALLAVALPRMFVAERAGDPIPLLRQVTFAALIYAVLGALLLVLLSPLVPWLFGVGFEASTQYVVLLSGWVPLYALHMCGANALVAAGGKLPRLAVEGAGLMLIIALNLLLLPRLGVVGSAASLLSGEMVMALACWSLLARVRRAARCQ